MPESSRIPVRAPSVANSCAGRGDVDAIHRAGLWLPVLRRVLGVEPGLDRRAMRRRRFGVQVATIGDRDLQLDQIEAGGLLGDRVLDLQPGVHLQEEELPGVVGEELHRPGTGVADRARGQAGRLEQPVPHSGDALHQRGRRLFDDLLVPALNRALPLADRPHRAVRVGHHLHLDVVSGGQVALAEHRRVAERGLGLTLRRRDFAWQRVQLIDNPHAATTTAGGCLHQHRQLRGGDGAGVEFLEHRNPGRGHHLLGLDLGAHRAHRIHRRADPH